jgi:hypothetical protein
MSPLSKTAIAIAVAMALGAGLGCASSAPPLPPPPPPPPTPAALLDGPVPGSIPRVVRRIVAEEQDLVERSFALAEELPDSRGRERARREIREVAEELDRIRAPLANAEQLDDTVMKLIQLDTRIALLHEALRTATNRTTAVIIE